MIKHPPTPQQLTLQLDELPELILQPYQDMIFEPTPALSLESPPELKLEPVVELKLQPVPELILEIDTDPIFSIRIKQSKRHRRNGASR
jgi:hypothetical protein